MDSSRNPASRQEYLPCEMMATLDQLASQMENMLDGPSARAEASASVRKLGA